VAAQPSFLDESDLLVQTDRSIVVSPDLQCDLVRPRPLRPFDPAVDETGSDPHAAKAVEDRHSNAGDTIRCDPEIDVTDDAPGIFGHESRERRRLAEVPTGRFGTRLAIEWHLDPEPTSFGTHDLQDAHDRLDIDLCFSPNLHLAHP
jgi:hypothetical protein